MLSRHLGNIILIVFALSSLFSGCNSSSNNTVGNQNISIPVTVTDHSGNKVQGVTVVLGDSNGAMKSYGVTDENGQITFSDAPADATITAATSCLYSGSTSTSYSIDIHYDVNAPVTLELNLCSTASYSIPPPASADVLGTMTVNVTDTPIEVTRNQLTVGRQGFVNLGGIITQQTVTMTTNDLDSDGTFSISVYGMDANDARIAYAIVSKQTFTDGITVDVSMQRANHVQYQITNIIPNIPIAISPSITTIGTNPRVRVMSYPPYPLASMPSSTTLNVPYIPTFGNGYSHTLQVFLDQDQDGVDDSQQTFLLNEFGDSNPSNQSFDLSKALTAPYVTVLNSNSSTPTFSWTVVDSAATDISCWISARHSPDVYLLVGLSGLSRTRTRITYPELPDSLAKFRPTQVDYFNITTSVFDGGVFKTSSGYYRSANP